MWPHAQLLSADLSAELSLVPFLCEESAPGLQFIVANSMINAGNRSTGLKHQVK